MKRMLLLSFVLLLARLSGGQTVDSISFHLYTDSLKKGTHNYINIDGKLANGKWIPLGEKEIIFSSSHGTFNGNELIIPADFREEKVTIKAVLRDHPDLYREITIWIKKLPDPASLPTREEVMKDGRKSRKKKSKN